METKICNVCSIEKSITEFGIFHNNKKLRGYCKECEKEKRKHRDVAYRVQNKDRIKTSAKNYKIKHKDVIKEREKIYRETNKEKIREKNRNWRNKIKNDPLYKTKFSVSKMIHKVIKRNGYSKKSKTNFILGCSYDEFKLYLESKFEPWMNWDNYGNPKDGIYEPNKTWDIDHIVPINKANSEEELIKLNHYTNLQPLCSYKNRFIKRGD